MKCKVIATSTSCHQAINNILVEHNSTLLACVQAILELNFGLSQIFAT